jgi:hypothetical protein
MDKSKIIENLEEFLKNHKVFKEKCEVAYLMIEIRKVLDCGGISYQTLRFYCNWVLHNKLDHKKTTSFLSKMFDQDIDFKKSGKEIARNMHANHKSFFLLSGFKLELNKFFKDNNLSSDLVNINKNWITFIKLLLEIIKECSVEYNPSKINKLELKRHKNGNYSYKFSLTNRSCKPIIKLKF